MGKQMEKKRMAIVAGEKKYADFLREDLSRYLGEYAEINSYSLEEVKAKRLLEEEVVGVTLSAFEAVKRYLKKTAQVTTFELALTKKNLEPLQKLPEGTRALFVNLDYRSCVQMILEIYNLGIQGIELIPYWAGDYDKSIKTAVTPNVLRQVPDDIEEIINIGFRHIALHCVARIAEMLELGDFVLSSQQFRRGNETFALPSSLEGILGENEDLESRIYELIQLMERGVLITNAAGNICVANHRADKILLTQKKETLIGENIYEILREKEKIGSLKEELLKINGRNIMITSNEIRRGEAVNGYIFLLEDFEENEKKQHGMRVKLSKMNHKAKYDFSKIIGESRSLRDSVAEAKRMALSDFPVLITGESGTGKEIFAQSIHMASERWNGAFVAVNCAAIPENLLESEMFGYEEGAFTGAKKGGKAGYFEVAHNGTIFLDEIAELPMSLQSKLLRVLEEKEIIKIGSERVIKVDVRIIAATNKNLYQMVEDGDFREDLYYRLNVLPLQLSPLRERPEDIFILMQHFMEEISAELYLTEDAKEAFLAYPWKGNVRELRNAVEFLACLGKSRIEKADLPVYIRQPADRKAAPPQEDIYDFILRNIYEAERSGKRVGRRSLEQISEKQGLFFSEMEIRKAIGVLKEKGLAEQQKGRGGSRLTVKGRIFCEERF